MLLVAYGLVIASWIITFVALAARKRTGDSFLSKVFTSNKDLDTTLLILLRGAVVFATLAIVVIFFSMFHDDLDKSDVGMLGMHVISMAGNALTLVSVMNGHEKKTDKGIESETDETPPRADS